MPSDNNASYLLVTGYVGSTTPAPVRAWDEGHCHEDHSLLPWTDITEGRGRRPPSAESTRSSAITWAKAKSSGGWAGREGPRQLGSRAAAAAAASPRGSQPLPQCLTLGGLPRHSPAGTAVRYTHAPLQFPFLWWAVGSSPRLSFLLWISEYKWLLLLSDRFCIADTAEVQLLKKLKERYVFRAAGGFKKGS